MTKRKDRFDWSGGHPALDLVNTLDERPFPEPIETLATYRDLVNFTELAGLIGASTALKLRSLNSPAGARVLRRTRELREHLFSILAANDIGHPVKRASLDAIALEVRRAHANRTFTAAGRSNIVTHRWVLPTSPEVPLQACALAVESLLVSADHGRIRECGAVDCKVYFIDTSKAHRRQWCSMQNCGNREKQRRWRSSSI